MCTSGPVCNGVYHAVGKAEPGLFQQRSESPLTIGEGGVWGGSLAAFVGAWITGFGIKDWVYIINPCWGCGVGFG
jgi:hypothetical protein